MVKQLAFGTGSANSKLRSSMVDSINQNIDIKGKKPHYEFIDLAKGICILLVIAYHVDGCKWAFSNGTVDNFFLSFRIPFYFFLSGLFLSVNHGYVNFVKKKINRLCIPFVFFYLLTVIYVLCYHKFYSTIINPGYDKDIFDSSIIHFLYNEDANGLFPNLPIWFLVSLFTTYMLFIFISFMSKNNLWVMSVFAIIMGVAGFALNSFSINLPLYLDTSLSCMPFVTSGAILRKKFNILKQQSVVTCLELSFLLFVITALTANGTSVFYKNQFQCNVFCFLVSGISGSCAVFYLAKAINRIPVINYLGRYSIVALGVHSLFISFLSVLIDKTMSSVCPTYVCILVLFVLVILCCLLSIFIMTKYLPYLVAQKDLIPTE